MKFINQIIQGDCTEVLKHLPDNSIDFVLTDPPYLCNFKDRSGRTLRNDQSHEWLNPAFLQIYRLLKENSLTVCFYGWPKVNTFVGAWRQAGFWLAAHLVFTKSYASNTARRFVKYQHESAFLLAKGQPEKPANPISDVQRFRYVGNRAHPTQKAVESLMPLIKS